MANQIQVRRDTSSNWTSANPILALGEFGYDTTLNKLKIGDGTTVWVGLGELNAFGEWRDILSAATLPATGTATPTDFYMPHMAVHNTTFTAGAVFYFDPADYAVTSRTTQVRVVANAISGTAAPTAHTATMSLYLTTTAANVPAKSGAAVATSAVVVTNTANTRFVTAGAAATAPAAGYYMLLGSNSASPGQTMNYNWKIQVRVN